MTELMKKIWICPVCRSSSTRRYNLEAHIKNCHAGTDASPIGFDPLLREYAVPRPEDITYYRESFPQRPTFNNETKVDDKETSSSVRDRTRMLNELSDYGDALIRFKKHAPVSIDPSILAMLMASHHYSSARTRDTNYSLQEAVKSFDAECPRQANGSRANCFRAYSGNICKTCGEVTVLIVPKFPPVRTASEYHLAKWKNSMQKKPLPTLVPSLISLQDELVDKLGYCVSKTFGEKKYLHCKRLDIKENFWTVTQNREAVEAKMGIPGRINRVKMVNLKLDHWAVRAYKFGRTEISESEVAEFLRNAQATYAIFWAQLDGLPEYYFMWIDEEKPLLEMDAAEILRSLGT